MTWDSPIEICGHKVKNRIVFAPISGNWADRDGLVTQKIIRFYKEEARGGCGMIVIGGVAVNPEAKGTNNSLMLCNEKHAAGFRRIAASTRKDSCFISVQLMHVGGQGNPKLNSYYPISPSGVKCNVTGLTPEVLDLNGIRRIRDAFINSAILAKNAGFPAVEIHLAHGYLLHEFLSGVTNKRADEYGGSLENKLRLIIEIIEGIKSSAAGLCIGVRVSGEDYLEGGINENVNRGLLPLLEQAGIAYFSVTAGIYDTSRLKHEAMQRGDFFKYSKAIKSIVKRPVIGTGKVLDLETAQEHLKNADCDMVGIGRGLIADPLMINKVKKGLEFYRCTECEECMYLRHGREYLSCPVRKI